MRTARRRTSSICRSASAGSCCAGGMRRRSPRWPSAGDGKRPSTDWRTAIDRKDIDAIDISLPNHLHAPVAIAAAQAGKMVLCEKPLALSLDEAQKMADAARAVPTLVWFNYRRVPAIAYARQLIDEGRIGTVYHYDAAYRQQWGADTSRAATWRMDPALAGSGVADDLLTHLLDTALYLNGPVKEGIAVTRTFAPNRAVDDAFVAMVNFENGSVGTFEATRFGIGIKNGNTLPDPRVGRHAALQPRAPQSSRVRGRVRAFGRTRPARPARDRHEASDLPATSGGPATSSATSTRSSRPSRSSSSASPAANDSAPISPTRVEVQRILDALQRSAKTRQWTGC